MEQGYSIKKGQTRLRDSLGLSMLDVNGGEAFFARFVGAAAGVLHRSGWYSCLRIQERGGQGHLFLQGRQDPETLRCIGLALTPGCCHSLIELPMGPAGMSLFRKMPPPRTSPSEGEEGDNALKSLSVRTGGPESDGSKSLWTVSQGTPVGPVNL